MECCGKHCSCRRWCYCWRVERTRKTSYDLRSPNNKIEVKIRTANGVRYDVLVNGRAVLQDCTLSLDVDHKKFGVQAKVLKHKESSHDEKLEPVVRQKFAKIRDNYKELHLDMDGGYAVTFRAYNEGVSYRLETSLAAAGSEDLRRRDEFEFYKQQYCFLPGRRKLHVAQRTEIFAATLGGYPS